MDAEFWHARWDANQIGFHQSETNKLLMKHWPTVCPDAGREVFVPLCGKSLDMLWLADRGHGVVGVELSPVAARAFFLEHNIQASSRAEGHFEVLSGNGIEIWVGDFFSFPAERLRQTVAAFDRASLIALPGHMRAAYARQMSDLLPADAKTMLLTIAYDESEMEGPPFSVSDDEVHRLFGGMRDVSHVETRDALAGSRNLQERGVSALTTSVFVIGDRLP